MVRFTARRLRLRKHLPTTPCASMVRPLLSSSTFFADVVIWLLPYPRHMALLSGLRSFDIGWSSRPSAAAHLARWSAYLRSLFSACANTYIRTFLTIGGILAPTGWYLVHSAGVHVARQNRGRLHTVNLCPRQTINNDISMAAASV